MSWSTGSRESKPQAKVYPGLAEITIKREDGSEHVLEVWNLEASYLRNGEGTREFHMSGMVRDQMDIEEETGRFDGVE